MATESPWGTSQLWGGLPSWGTPGPLTPRRWGGGPGTGTTKGGPLAFVSPCKLRPKMLSEKRLSLCSRFGGRAGKRILRGPRQTLHPVNYDPKCLVKKRLSLCSRFHAGLGPLSFNNATPTALWGERSEGLPDPFSHSCRPRSGTFAGAAVWPAPRASSIQKGGSQTRFGNDLLLGPGGDPRAPRANVGPLSGQFGNRMKGI